MSYSVEVTGLSLADSEALISALKVNLPQWLISFETIELWEPPLSTEVGIKMKIETNMPGEFGNELIALLAKYKVRWAGGWDDGNLYLEIEDQGATEFYVKFEEKSVA